MKPHVNTGVGYSVPSWPLAAMELGGSIAILPILELTLASRSWTSFCMCKTPAKGSFKLPVVYLQSNSWIPDQGGKILIQDGGLVSF